ncbi:Glucosyl-3-phosphoglycerate phosphatase [Nocardioides dokdonensis FR1436]|uniref:Glucosyl-3-phosphoglycerate phosphatase n=1 Tax=Nocardioides dokdonensis FR1436 TaxID=1300347 RepID=A0A1A9GS48_9ACTN|nr:histidine phosphatase family protein [Nocardioides dokdonensis]ANH40261.1 Glucosyl-3-phosphoglycerate phosphatase [Nocardioides dokdonensis FR1436]
MSRTLVLLRHGQTASNRTGRIQGQLDVDLDDTGRDQAERTAPVVAALAPDLVWCSDLVRARSTVAPVLRALGRAPASATYDARLREFHLGERQGISHEEYRALDAEEFTAFRAGHYDVVPGAEKAAEVRMRMAEALGELLAATPAGGTALAVSHGAAIRVATGALLGWPEEQFRTLHGLGNCGWAVFREHPEDGELRLEAYHRTIG